MGAARVLPRLPLTKKNSSLLLFSGIFRWPFDPGRRRGEGGFWFEMECGGQSRETRKCVCALRRPQSNCAQLRKPGGGGRATLAIADLGKNNLLYT